MESIYIKNNGRLSARLKKEKQRAPFLQLLFVLLLLQQAFSNSHSAWPQAISYLDEIIALCLLAVFVWRGIQGFRLYRKEQIILLLAAATLFLGFLSSVLSRLQPSLYVLADAFICFKFLFAYFGIRTLYPEGISQSFIEVNFFGIAKIFAVLFFILTLHDSFFSPFFPVSEYRYFTYSIQLFYPHPQHLATACIILVCALASSEMKIKGNMVYILMLSFVIIRTLRVKAIGFVALFFLLLVCVCVLHIRSPLLLFVPLICCGVFIGWEQIQTYFFNYAQARAILTWDSLKIASQYFPFGAGFATFGSYMAYVHYSPLYRSFGYNHLYGMAQNAGGFLSDTFWPIVIAQFGYFGLLLFLLILISFLLIIVEIKNKPGYLAGLSILIYMLISSTSESSFFNPFATLYFIILGLLVSRNLPKEQTGLTEKPNPMRQILTKSKYIK